ncbi:DEAD/DEAH box helicase [Gloeocapsopsis dulcis]|uniref:Uncharacterized protein n=1 Tax=Gloeocapsopsis dulcis AAB1 = 1H9 TaxID=1433147 RepID=A0A6N8G227_9CHRO|nr:nuclease-related domain-containing DEAD/DEAH box helicase [Gloeocapsopsis dulcis]MUL39383.1 hypothetical protein [Gloeocapsopsis dulcis AAB1 = 1H9]WNN92176.1 hypothetical protein P0S91_26765 [Gloeocapsopsis dulcis]
MDFFPYEPFDDNKAQKKVWEWLKDAFKDEEGVAYYRYPIFTKTGRLNREPDILILHRELGLWVIECKGCFIDNIKGIQGHEWQMNNWYRETDTPVAQAEDEMFAIKNKLDERRETRGKVNCHFRVALPHVKQKEWEEKGFSQLPSTEGVVLVYENLTPSALKKHLAENARKCKLSEQDWEVVKGVLGGTLPSKPPRDIPTQIASNNPIRVIRAIETKLKVLDENQQKIAFEIPDGSQRLRGLAGTGKTVLFAKRAAKIHIKYPDWTIGFVFFTRSLYDQILELVACYHREMHPDHQDPDWTKLKVLHAWGGREQAGFYYNLALKSGVRPRTVRDVNNEIGNGSPRQSFEYVCECLKRDARNIPIIYDVLLIDEGQDLPPTFYRLARQTLSDPYRFYWAYDEAQGIGSLIVPKPETIFGRNLDGSLVVDVSGSYEGGISKSHKMNRCYRTPRLLLMTAHAVNMGLFRTEGVLQGVTQQKDWKDLGYEVIDGDFRPESVKAGRKVTITRALASSPHPIDQNDFELKDALGTSLTIKPFDTEYEEREWIAQQVAKDIELGFDPWDITIVVLSGDSEKDYLSKLRYALEQQGVDSYIAGVDGDRSIFRKDGCVTISNIFRAKGNEAWKVYACRFHYATQPLLWKQEEELHKRNEAFVALTRARVWCIATGVDSSIFDELQQAISQYPNFTFPTFNKSSLKRLIEDEGDDS